jgi:GWxTD domain-containing protein
MMKSFARIFSRIAAIWLGSVGLMTAVSGQTQPTLHLDVLRFAVNGNTPYLEVQSEIIPAPGLTIPTDGPFAELTLIATRGEDILNFTKTELLASPTDSTGLAGSNEQFLHIERLPVPAGSLSLEVTVRGLGGLVWTETTTIPVDMPHGAAPWFSDVMLIEAYAPASDSPNTLTRSGFDMLPIVGSMMSENAADVPIYAELYGTHEIGDSLFLLTAEWQDANGLPLQGTKRFFRKETAKVVPVFERMPMAGTDGAAQPLSLHLEALTREGHPIASRTLPVQLVNPTATTTDWAATSVMPFVQAFTDSLALLRHIEDHHPYGTHAEQQFIDNVLPLVDVRQMQGFLDGFWRSHAPENPEAGWRDYTRAIAYVDSTYGACRKGRGARTDMGYVYLRYGPPNTIVQRHNETEYYPYEIWHYHQTRGQTNKRILFMCPSAVAECFDMLHTDIRGETFNPDWLTILKTRENGLRITDSQVNRLNPRQNTFSREEPEDLFFNPR